MKKNNFLILGIFLVLTILFFSGFSSAYMRATVQGVSPGILSGGFGSSGGEWVADRTMCEAGQDFVIQIPPFGCEPAVVRQDLLEEQNVPVFCKLAATKINPFIGVEVIDSISFSGKQLPPSISGVGFYPAQAALGVKEKLNSPILDNIGYAVIVLKKQPNASEIPSMISGNLTATLQYDVKKAYGIGDAKFYLPEISNDAVWEDSMKQYGFWKGKGYVRAESINSDKATISVYTDTKKLKTVSLDKGETSSDILLPGFDCLVSTKIKLEDLVNPDERAVLSVNGDIVQLGENEQFLNNKCTLKKIYNKGLTKKAEISCKADEKTQGFELVLTPRVSLEIDGKKGDYDTGQHLYTGKDEEGRVYFVYLAYVGTKKNSGKLDDLYVLLVATSEDKGEKLSDSDISRLSDIAERMVSRQKVGTTGESVVTDWGKQFVGTTVSAFKQIIPTLRGEIWGIRTYAPSEENLKKALGSEVKVVNFASPINADLSSGGSVSMPVAKTTFTVDDMYKLIKTEGELSSDQITSIKNSLNFLLTEFGQSLVTDGIELAITADATNYQRNFFSEKSDRKFSFTADDINNKKVLAHELFHAFYETNSFIQANNDLTVEGLAAYAEYKFDSPSSFRANIENELKTSKNKPANLEQNFNSYDDFQLNYMYAHAANKFIGKSRAEIRALLTQGATETEIVKLGESSAKGYYASASQDYSKVIGVYAAEKDPLDSKVILGEQAFIENIKLAEKLSQKQDVNKLCKQFNETYPKSERFKDVELICNPLRLSSPTSVSKEVSINSRQITISLQDVKKPGFEEYGARIIVKYNDARAPGYFELRKDEPVYIDPKDEQAYVQLISIEKDSINFNLKRTPLDKTDAALIAILGSKHTLKKGTPNSFSSPYTFDVVEIYDKKNAKVVVIPSINKQKTEVNFSFNIGIEKRAIQLSPEKTKQKIESLNKTISDWTEINNKLTNFVEGMKGACLATGLALTMKNFKDNLGGKSIARQEVMLGEGGWNQKCADMVSKKTEDPNNKGKFYTNPNECIMANAANIEKEVDALYSKIQNQDEGLKQIQQKCPSQTNVFLEKIIDEKCVREEMSKVLVSELKNSEDFNKHTFMFKNEPVSAAYILSLIETNQISIEDMRAIQLYARTKNTAGLETLSTKKLDKTLSEIYSSKQQELEFQKAIKDAGITKIPENEIPYVSLTKDDKLSSYYGRKYKDVMGEIQVCSLTETCTDPRGCPGNQCDALGIKKDTPVQSFVSGGKYYLGTLEQAGTKYTIKNLYDVRGKGMVLEDDATGAKIKSQIIFELADEQSYLNEYRGSAGSSVSGPVLRCYDTEPYKGYPGIVPVDTKKGWYVSISQNLPVYRSVGAYQESGRVMSFYLCNVGKDGQEENRGGDDKCTMVNFGTGQDLSQIGAGLTSSQATKLLNDARKAIEAGQKACLSGKKGEFNLGDNAKRIKMGTPVADIPDLQCTNFMSASDCKILFNVCDPVICPQSRCNFGGEFPVRDVIQSGIIGSLVLCSKNSVLFGGDVYIPVCLSGVKAGIDGLLAVFKPYRDCLQENLETGKMTGICDEIYSIHLCEFFWRQTLPLAKMIVPKAIEWVMGKSVRGGGEYLSVQDAWQTAGQSMDYFAQYYAAEAYAAFKARITQEVTDAVCKTYISGAYPEGGKILDTLTKAKSPPQFHGRFDEIPFTTATNPPVSHYKVFYNIYAGEDSRAYYQVYLTEGATSSYYQDTSLDVVVGSGYLQPGGIASETKDFTAASGYKKLCIVVNGQRECGFKQVSTSFALDWVADQYVKSQANETNIKSESACVSGTTSAWSLATISVEGAADELISPKLYNRGVIRICASENPGSGTDATNQRWVSVGYCGKKELKCWLDTQSVKDSVNFNSSTDFIKNVTDNFIKQMQDEGKYFSNDGFANALGEISKETDSISKIGLINSMISKAGMNAQKGKLYLLRADAYSILANIEFQKAKAEADKLAAEAARIAEANAAAKKAAEEAAKAAAQKAAEEKAKISPPSQPLSPEEQEEQYKDMSACYVRLEKKKSILRGIVRMHLKPYSSIISRASEEFGVAESLIGAIIEIESEGNALAKNPSSGARGLMQIMPKGAAADIQNGGCKNLCYNYYGSDWEADPETNVMMGTCYLKCLRDVYKIPEGMFTIASYNGGLGTVQKACKIDSVWKKFSECEMDLPLETRNYVAMVSAAKECLEGVDFSESPSLPGEIPGPSTTTPTACESTEPEKAKLYVEAINYFKGMPEGTKYTASAGTRTRIDNLFKNDLITKEQYYSIRGWVNRVTNPFDVDAPFGWGEKTVGNVINILNTNYASFCFDSYKPRSATFEYIQESKSFKLTVDGSCEAINYTIYYDEVPYYLDPGFHTVQRIQKNNLGNPLDGITSTKTDEGFFVAEIPLTSFQNSRLTNTEYYAKVQCYVRSTGKSFGMVLESTRYSATGSERVLGEEYSSSPPEIEYPLE